jgi:hypothetical protein
VTSAPPPGNRLPGQAVGPYSVPNPRAWRLRGKCRSRAARWPQRPSRGTGIEDARGPSGGYLRAKYGLHAGDEVEVVEAGGALQIVRSEGAESRGQRLVRRLRNTATGRDIAGMSTDQIMALLRAE